jgi:hypothetical protein
MTHRTKGKKDECRILSAEKKMLKPDNLKQEWKKYTRGKVCSIYYFKNCGFFHKRVENFQGKNDIRVR